MQLGKRFSLDYLISGSANRASRPPSDASRVGSVAIQDALNIYTAPILRELGVSNNQSRRMFDLMDCLQKTVPGTDIDTLRGVIKWMEKSNMVGIIEADPHGNDLIQKKV